MFDLLGATVTPSATKSINKTAFLFPREKVMTTLALNIQTMSSREIAEVVNSRHDSVKRAIERLVEKGVISQPPLVDGEKAANGVVEKLYRVNERDSYVVVAQLCPEFTAKLVDYWQTTKNQNTFHSIKRDVETFKALKDLAETFGLEGNQALLAANKATVKLTGFNPLETLQIELVKEVQVLNLTPTQIGKELNPPLSAVATNKLLSSLGFQEKLHDQWVPTAKGKAFAIFLDTGKKHSDGTPITQLKWLSTLIPHIS